jgi:hypothetical protein
MTEYLDKLAKIALLIKKMDLPDYRKSVKHNDDLRWLKNNLETRNGKHKNYAEVMSMINEMI